MSFRTQIADDIKKVILNTDDAAETITYTPASGSAKSIKAIVLRGDVRDEPADDGTEKAQRADVHVSTDPSTGVSAPSVKDSVTFDGVAWAVDSWRGGDARVHTIEQQGWSLGSPVDRCLQFLLVRHGTSSRLDLQVCRKSVEQAGRATPKPTDGLACLGEVAPAEARQGCACHRHEG